MNRKYLRKYQIVLLFDSMKNATVNRVKLSRRNQAVQRRMRWRTEPTPPQAAGLALAITVHIEDGGTEKSYSPRCYFVYSIT